MLFGVVLLGIIAASPVCASDDDAEEPGIPKTGQPTTDFYNAAGTGVKLTAVATPTELNRDQWLTLTLTIANLVNAPDVSKPSLKELATFESYQIEEGADLDPKIDPTTRDRRVFIYRLRPLSEQVALIPEIPFHYYDPKRKFAPSRPQDQFPRTYSNALTIRVLPPAEPPPAAPVPLDIPSVFVDLATGADALEASSANPPIWIWLVALIVPPLLSIIWVVAWQRCFPNAARLVILKRNRAVRHALAAIAAANGLPAVKVADAVSAAVLAYLRERFQLPPGAFTPLEIAAHLQLTTCPVGRIARVQSFFRDCDDRRFASEHQPADGLVADAEQLVIALEEPA